MRQKNIFFFQMRPIFYLHTRNKPVQNTFKKIHLALKIPPSHPQSHTSGFFSWQPLGQLSFSGPPARAWGQGVGSAALRAKVRVHCWQCPGSHSISQSSLSTGGPAPSPTRALTTQGRW